MALSDNLAAFWTFDEGAGTSVADATGNGHGLTLNGIPAWTTGRLGEALQFGSTGQNAQGAPGTLDYTGAGALTVSAWIRADGALPYPAKPFVRWDSGSANPYLLSMRTDSASAFTATFGTVAGTKVATATGLTPTIGTWYHIVGVFDGTSVTIYRNGVAFSSTSFAATTLAKSIYGSQSLVLGANAPTGASSPCTVDAVGIWTRALTSAEVAELYNSGAGLQYPFAAGGGTDTLSASGLTSAAPTLGSASVGQKHGLAGSGVGAPPSLGSAIIGQVHDVAADGLATGEAALGSATLSQVHGLDTGIIETTPTLGTPALFEAATEIVKVRPTATDASGGWTTNSGGSDLHVAVDETSANDADFIRSHGAGVARVKLGTFSNTDFVGNLTLRYRIGKSGPQTINQTVRLMEGVTRVAEWQHDDVSALATVTQSVDPALISDFADLYLEVEV